MTKKKTTAAKTGKPSKTTKAAKAAKKPVAKAAPKEAKSAAKTAAKPKAKPAAKAKQAAGAKAKPKPAAKKKASAKPTAAAPKASKPVKQKKQAESAKPAAAEKTVEKVAPAAPVLTAAQRQKLVAKIHKVLKSHYTPRLPDTSRPLLEQVLFACCLENAHYEDAEKALTGLLENSFDLNEVRVTTVAELAELLTGLPDPSRAALSLRRVLQSVFEATYNFTLDHVKKQSVSQGVKTLESLQALTPFTLVYINSTALGGHGVPLDQGSLAALYLVGLISLEEHQQAAAPGLDRLVTKKIGREFSSLLHQFGADLFASLHGTKVKAILAEISSDVKDRMPKRGEPLPVPELPPVAQRDDAGVAEKHRPAGPQAAARPAGKTPQPPPGSGPKRDADGTPIGPRSGPKPFVVKPNMARSITIKPELAAKRAAAEEAAAKKANAAAKPKGAAKTPKASAAKPKKSSSGSGDGPTRKLAKKKPR